MIEPLYATALFLIHTIFSLYAFVLGLRLLLVWVYADYYQPLVQFVVKLTQKPLTPFRKIFPIKKNIEWGTLIFLALWLALKIICLGLLGAGIPNILGLGVLILAELFKLFLSIYFYAIVLQALFSWIPTYSPMIALLEQITAPVMKPIKKLIPPIAGIDISPIPALILISAAQLLLVDYLFILGSHLS